MKERTANFFWQGPSLSVQEHVCISSFIRHNFIVNVYTYNDILQIPPQANLKDASEILPYKDLNKFTQEGIKGNLAAFSDAFRYHLLKKNGGWWFDTDVMCLVGCEKFENLLNSKDKKISFGCERINAISSGVLYANDDLFIDMLIKRLEKSGNIFKWGEIGPKLVKDVVTSMKLEKYCEDKSVYYPIHYNELHKMYDPSYCEWCESQAKDSLAIHLWNEFRRACHIPGNILPPDGSFLYKKFIECCPELVTMPSLPVETILVLIQYADMKIKFQYLENFENMIMSNPFTGNLVRIRRRLRNHFKRHGEN